MTVRSPRGRKPPVVPPEITPRSLGFVMPPEWAPHAATWLTWPRDPLTWPGKVPIAGQVMARWVREITRERPGTPPERVEILCFDAAQRRQARQILTDWDINLGRVGLHLVPANDVWIRDYGPIFVTRERDRGDGYGRKAITGWAFDAWGGKGQSYYGASAAIDGEVPGRIAWLRGLPIFRPGQILEGGGIEVNGAGTLMATAACLLKFRKRPGATAAEQRRLVEAALHDYLGITHCLWLTAPVRFEGDDTDGHVDNLARFTSPRHIVTVVEHRKSEPLYAPLKANLRQLQRARGADGKLFEVAALPVPGAFRFRCPRHGRAARWRYPASYANFYIANNTVLVPVYADPCDLAALDTLRGLFPGRDVIPVDCCDYILGQGAIHCSTQQEPA